MYFPPTLVLLFLSTTTTTTASPLTQSNGDDPAPFLAELQPSGNDQHLTGNPNACTSSSEESFQFSMGRRGVGTCPPSPETIPGKQPAPVPDSSPPTFNEQPLQFTSPENVSPLRTAPGPEDDKCPTHLMKMSRIPVCDSGKRGRDLMRLPGEQTYTIFNIRFCMSTGPVHLSLTLAFDRLWAASWHSFRWWRFIFLKIPTRTRVCRRVNHGVALQPEVR